MTSLLATLWQNGCSHAERKPSSLDKSGKGTEKN